ncbi:hypothetical protein Lferr_0843 [Acidithiobacillus ferrooxidans ATCC 53993]|nr:hypothetical protein Lferr_0843 [Acidithiobacillus ferrooxidans ATCC 53993]PZD82235.1 hypothetical protein DN052_04170 [Acidithiobacillus ferrooxidans]
MISCFSVHHFTGTFLHRFSLVPVLLQSQQSRAGCIARVTLCHLQMNIMCSVGPDNTIIAA